MKKHQELICTIAALFNSSMLPFLIIVVMGNMHPKTVEQIFDDIPGAIAAFVIIIDGFALTQMDLIKRTINYEKTTQLSIITAISFSILLVVFMKELEPYSDMVRRVSVITFSLFALAVLKTIFRQIIEKAELKYGNITEYPED